MVTSLMLAAQAHSAHAFVLSKSNSETPVVFSSNTTLLVSTAVNSNISPTSVSSSASNFIYPAVSGRCQFVNDFIVDTETSVLAYSPVSTDFVSYVLNSFDLLLIHVWRDFYHLRPMTFNLWFLCFTSFLYVSLIFTVYFIF